MGLASGPLQLDRTYAGQAGLNDTAVSFTFILANPHPRATVPGMHLLLVSAALACMSDEGMSFRGDIYPVDANLELWGRGLQEALVFDESGAEVAVALEERCFDSDANVGGSCRYSLAPEHEWMAGAAYTVWVSFQAYGSLREDTFDLFIAEDGRRVEVVTGTPDLTVARVAYEAAHHSCEPTDPVKYALTVTPAAPGDAEGLSYLQITRADGYVRSLYVPEDGAPFDVEFLATRADEDCFTIVQIDGAGNESESLDTCAEPEAGAPADACGCGTNQFVSGWVVLVGALAGLRRRSVR